MRVSRTETARWQTRPSFPAEAFWSLTLYEVDGRDIIHKEKKRADRSSRFHRRATHPPPERLPLPPGELAVGYRREAEQVKVTPGLQDAHRLLASWIDPILAGRPSLES